MSVTKQCTKCGEVKALDRFHADKRLKSGHRADCKNCGRIHTQENKERISARRRKYQQENKNQIKDYMRKYRVKNPEVHRRALRKRRALLRNLPHQPLTPQQYDILHRQKYEIFGGIASGN